MMIVKGSMHELKTIKWLSYSQNSRDRNHTNRSHFDAFVNDFLKVKVERDSMG